jgi:glutathione peroxidase
MMLFFKALVMLFAGINSYTQSNIYQFQFNNIDGNTISLSQYQGKKILLVNVATQNATTNQYAELQLLHNRFKDSGLVIIAISSNSFGNEPKTNTAIKAYCIANYSITFPLGAKASVKGADIIPLYKWLTTKAENGLMDSEVRGDFQKYLINTEGRLVGVFGARVTPMSEVMINAIRNTQ